MTEKREVTAQQRDIESPPDELTKSLELSMRRLVMITRGLGWFGMLLLVIATLVADADADRRFTIGALVLATVWTVVTWWAHLRRSRLGSLTFVIADGAVGLAVASASYLASAGDLFHGAYPISWLAVLAYGGGLRWAVGGSILLSAQQAILLLQSGRGAVAATGSLVLIIYGVVFGWLFGVIRNSDTFRRRMAAELTTEREESARKMERLELANRLHDSALQTLQVIDVDADDAERVRTLARRQSRELRSLVESYRSTDGSSFKMRLVSTAHDVEELFNIEVSTVIRIEMTLDESLLALVDATREALTNAAKYSGSERIDVYAAIEDEEARVYVLDDGEGFDPGTVEMGHGIEQSIRARLESVGGAARIKSAPGEGTEVLMAVAIDRTHA